MSDQKLQDLIKMIGSKPELLEKIKSITSKEKLQLFLRDLGFDLDLSLPSSIIHSLSIEIPEAELEMVAGGKPPRSTFALGCTGKTNQTVLC